MNFNRFAPKALYCLLLSGAIHANSWGVTPHPNLISPTCRATLSVSSVDRNHPAKHLLDGRLTHRWETLNEKEGAWVEARWDQPQTIRELWIVNCPTPFDMLLEPDSRTADFPAARKVQIDFSDGTSQLTELRLGRYYQILTLPAPKTVTGIKVTLESLWGNSQNNRTGLGKIQAYAQAHAADFSVELFDLYEMQGGKAVQSAKIRILNPGEQIERGKLKISLAGKPLGELTLETIPARSLSEQQIWIPAIYQAGEMNFTLHASKGARFAEAYRIAAKPYEKNYFDGGVFQILNTNHNDLGFLDTQFVTADYRGHELILPALELMRTHPEYKYHMESIEYLKEFLVRYPERREEIAQRMREGRFLFGASYVQNLQVHVGMEKLARQFYYGRRWLLENFPGCDSRFYSNVDVPGLTYQLPQVLRKAGVEYIIQGRFPWGYYYWQGLDGTSIPVYALRYTAARQLLNPINHTGWLHFQNIRESYYRSRNLPKQLIYDFSCDYLPPEAAMIPYVKEQNQQMKTFAAQWNTHFKGDTSKQITPPVLQFATPHEALDEMFGHGRLDIETVHGDWPMTWAYFDEPGHRDGLLKGRKGHNALLKAEQLNSWIKMLNLRHHYPQARLDSGWLAVCWPDHGWGGNRGIVTDSINEAFYAHSLQIASQLDDEAASTLTAQVAGSTAGQLPVMVYNASGWDRNDVVTGVIRYPAAWQGMILRGSDGEEIVYETIRLDRDQHEIEIAFEAREVPALGYRLYSATDGPSFGVPPKTIPADSIENRFVKVRFNEHGIASLYDKQTQQEVLRTDKFTGAEVVEFNAPGVAWNEFSEVKTDTFDRSGAHAGRVIRATESPVRYVIEKEIQLPDFTLRQRYILNKSARELIVESDLIDWKGVPNRELRLLFPMNLDPKAQISYEVPYGSVEMGRDEIDYSALPETTECQFSGERYARTDLPFREAINWVDASSGGYQGKGCLVASDMTLHLFRDESDSPVDYPIVQHVLLSTRKSLAWNPENWFVQPGTHTYRTALYPHEGNWRFGYRNGLSFNTPLTLTSGTVAAQSDSPSHTTTAPSQASLLRLNPDNLIVTACKQAEDGNGLIVRLYEAEGRYTKLRLQGFKPLKSARLTNLIEYDEQELPLTDNGTLEMEVKPWDIITLRLNFQ